MDRKINIIFIVVDALRAENLTCYGYNKPTSPTIDSLAKEGVLFENAYSCTDHTDPSFTTIFSGKYPLSHGIIHHGTVEEKEIQEFNLTQTKLLSQILKSRGYHTIAIDWLLRWHKRGYDFYGESMKEPGSSTSFGIFLKEKAREFIRKLPPHIELTIKRIWKSAGLSRQQAQNYTDLAIRLLKMQRGNFFMLIHYWDVHTPLDTIPNSYVNKFYDKKNSKTVEQMLKEIDCWERREKVKKYHLRGIKYIDEILARYDGAINFVDCQIARIINFLKRKGIYEQSLIILTGDHGDNLIRNGVFVGHCGLYDKVIHVPLIMAGGGLPQNKRIESLVQHVDIVPTVLDILDIAPNSYFFDGESLLPLIYEHKKQLRSSIYAMEATRKRFAIRTVDYKYIYSSSKEELFHESWKKKGVLYRPFYNNVKELYDLRKDPHESQNIIEDKPEVAKEMEDKLLKWIKKIETKKQRIIAKNKEKL